MQWGIISYCLFVTSLKDKSHSAVNIEASKHRIKGHRPAYISHIHTHTHYKKMHACARGSCNSW